MTLPEPDTGAITFGGLGGCSLIRGVLDIDCVGDSWPAPRGLDSDGLAESSPATGNLDPDGPAELSYELSPATGSFDPDEPVESSPAT